MLDWGAGARERLALRREYAGCGLRLYLFVGHTHWDHIQRFPFFQPAYTPGNRLAIYSPRGAAKSLEKVLRGQMDASCFPVSLSDLLARLQFVELEGPATIGGVGAPALFHHDPRRDDEWPDRMVAACHAYMAGHDMKFRCFAAAYNLPLMI